MNCCSSPRRPRCHSRGRPTNTYQGTVYSSSVKAVGDSFVYSRPTDVIRLRAFNFAHDAGPYQSYAVSPDAERFLYFQFVQPSASALGVTAGPDHGSGLVIAMHWEQGLGK